MSIRLHSKYGVNCSITKCFFCGKDDKIIMPGTSVRGFIDAGIADKDGKMPMNCGCVDMEPCQECQEYMKAGVLLMSVKDNDPEYRTGGWCVVKESVINNLINEENLRNYILKQRFAMVPDSVWDQVGFPRNEEFNNLKDLKEQ